MKKIICLLSTLCLLSVTIFSGCSSPTTNPNQTSSPNPSITPTPIATPSPTVTPSIAPSPTVTPSIAPSPTAPITTSIYSDGSKDGTAIHAYEKRNGGQKDYTDTNSTTLEVGGWHYDQDLGFTDNYGIYRSFLHFNISKLSGKTIKSAKLYLYRSQTNNNPGNLGNLYLDHLDYGELLDFSDYNIGSLESKAITLNSEHPHDPIGWETVDITIFIQNDASTNKNYSQYRLRRAIDYKENIDNRDFWYSGDAADEYKPKIVVTYQ